MIRFFCFVIALALVQAQVNPANSTLSVGVSTASLNQLLNLLVLPLIDQEIAQIGSELPQDCCYERDSTKMTIENLDIPADSIKTVGTISTTDSGALLSTATQLDLTFYYHLCQEIIGCDTLFFCKGDANLGVEVTTKFIIDIGSTPKGEPNITFDEFSLHLSIPSKKGLCLFLSGLLDTAVPILNDVLNIIVPNILTSAFDRINALNQTVALPDVPFDLYWALTDQTGTSIDGIGFQLILDVLIKSLGNQPGPFYPDPALPPILTLLQQEQVTLDFTDSLLNNLIDAIYLAENRQFSFKADGWDVKLNLESQPVISFTDGAGSDASELVFNRRRSSRRNFCVLLSPQRLPPTLRLS